MHDDALRAGCASKCKSHTFNDGAKCVAFAYWPRGNHGYSECNVCKSPAVTTSWTPPFASGIYAQSTPFDCLGKGGKSVKGKCWFMTGYATSCNEQCSSLGLTFDVTAGAAGEGCGAGSPAKAFMPNCNCAINNYLYMPAYDGGGKYCMGGTNYAPSNVPSSAGDSKHNAQGRICPCK